MKKINHFVKTGLIILCLVFSASQILAEYDSDGVDLLGRYPYGFCRTITPYGDHAVIGNGSAVQMIELDEMEPVGVFITESVITNICVSENYAFVTNPSDGLIILDISDPTSPIFVSSLAVDNYISACTIMGDYLFLGTYGSFRIINISDPTNPQLVSTFIPDDDLSFGLAHVMDSLVYVPSSSGLYILDITNPESPIQLSHLPSEFD